MIRNAPTRPEAETAASPAWRPAFFGVLLAALALRLAFLESMEFWWDEFVTIWRSMPDVPELLRGLLYQSPASVGTDCSPPLHHLLVHAALQVGRSETVIKLPSVLCGVTSIAFVLSFGRRAFGNRAGFLAGLFCALSLFHIYYSRDIRWYSTFFACTLGGLYLLGRALEDDAWKHWLGFGCCTALSLYAAYTAATYVAGEGLFLAGLVCRRAARGDRAGALRLIVRAGAALGLAVAAYAPWIPAQYIAFVSFLGAGKRVPFELGPFVENFRFFLEYFYQGSFNFLWLAAPLCLWGVLAALRDPARRGALLLMACWSLVPAVGVYAVKTEFGVSPKYIMSLFYFEAFTLALGVDAAVEAAGRLWRPLRGRAGYVLAAALLGLVGASNFNYLSFYQGKTVSSKALVRETALAAEAGDIVLYERERGFTAVGAWYLGDAFPTAGGDMGRAYRRFVLPALDLKRLPGAVPASRRHGGIVFRGGLVNRAPLAAVPDAAGEFRYEDRFIGLDLYRDAWATRNAAVDLVGGGLTPADLGRPGQATYALAAPEGMTLAAVRVEVEAAFHKRIILPPDGFVEVWAGGSPGTLRPVGRLDAAGAPPGAGEPGFAGVYVLAGNWTLDREDFSDGLAFVALRFSVGTVDGYVKTQTLRLQASLSGTPPPPERAALAQAEAVLANLPLGDPADAVGLEPGRVLAFAAPDSPLPADPDGRFGSAAQGTAFRTAHPGIEPVCTVKAPDGRALLEVFDPWLTPYLRLAGNEQRRLSFGGRLQGLKAPGSRLPALATWNRAVLPLSTGLPRSSVSVVNPGGQGFILARPQFDAESFDPGDFHSLRDVRILPPRPCLTCIRDEPCQATYRLSSLFPSSRLVLTTYPTLLNDAARKNRMRLSIAADGGEFAEVFSLASNGDGRQWGLAFPRVDEVVLDKPAREVLVRLEMTGDACQWWSGPDNPMTFEMFSDASMWSVPPSDSVELVNITPDGGQAALAVSGSAYPAWESLRQGLVLRRPWSWLFR